MKKKSVKNSKMNGAILTHMRNVVTNIHIRKDNRFSCLITTENDIILSNAAEEKRKRKLEKNKKLLRN